MAIGGSACAKAAVFALCAAVWIGPVAGADKAAKGGAQRTAAAAAFDPEPFALDRERVPADYRGHDPDKLVKIANKAPRKDKFDTSEAYAERLEAWRRTVAYGNVKAGDLIAIPVPMAAFTMDYRADISSMGLKPKSTVHSEEIMGGFFALQHEAKILPRTSGVTGMGVRFSYDRTVAVSYGVGTTNWDRLTSEVTFEVAPDIARKSDSWRALLIGEIDLPFSFSVEGSHVPSLSEPWMLLEKKFGLAIKLRALWLVAPDGQVMGRAQVAS